MPHTPSEAPTMNTWADASANKKLQENENTTNHRNHTTYNTININHNEYLRNVSPNSRRDPSTPRLSEDNISNHSMSQRHSTADNNNSNDNNNHKEFKNYHKKQPRNSNRNNSDNKDKCIDSYFEPSKQQPPQQHHQSHQQNKNHYNDTRNPHSFKSPEFAKPLELNYHNLLNFPVFFVFGVTFFFQNFKKKK